jgi:hypothetical protein
MQQCDVGVSRSAPHLFGKSGTAIAMLEHGMPVWLPRWDGSTPLDYTFRSDLIFANLRHAANASATKSLEPYSLLPQIASDFLSQLTVKELIETP